MKLMYSLCSLFRLYYKIFAKSYGAPTGEQMVKDLEDYISRFNLEKGEDCCRMNSVGKDLVVSICTPLMKRAHSLIRQSGELVFIDASGGVDRHHCRIFIVLTHSCAGGVPLGVFITTSESTEVITAGINLLKDLLPSNAFFGRGEKGPLVCMTDDSSAERSALQKCFPDMTLLLCTFHLLQAVWRYLWDAKNRVIKQDRPRLLGFFKAMVYADSEASLLAAYETLRSDPVAQKYEGFLAHTKDIFERRKEWAICLRNELPMRGNHTNNYAEAAMRVLKDKVFVRAKAFNVIQLLDFMLTRFEGYYERRFIDVANSRLDMNLSKRYMPQSNKIERSHVNKLSETTYSVKSETKEDVTYFVDNAFGLCTCYIGKTGAPCKHQHAVVKFFGVDSITAVPVTSTVLRDLLFQLATGTKAPDGWFQTLRLPASSPDDPTPTSQSHSQSHSLADGHQAALLLPTENMENGDVQGQDAWSLEQQRQMQNQFLARASSSQTSKRLPLSPLETNVNNDTDKVAKQIMLAATSICQRIEGNPSLIPSAKKFVNMVNDLHTDSALDSAMACFGKYSGLKMTKKMSKLHTCSSKIGVQPTAIARRKSALGGRKCLVSGRKPKMSLCPLKKEPFCVLPKRPKKAPHSLSQCVNNNQSLGKTHSAK